MILYVLCECLISTYIIYSPGGFARVTKLSEKLRSQWCSQSIIVLILRGRQNILTLLLCAAFMIIYARYHTSIRFQCIISIITFTDVEEVQMWKNFLKFSFHCVLSAFLTICMHMDVRAFYENERKGWHFYANAEFMGIFCFQINDLKVILISVGCLIW